MNKKHILFTLASSLIAGAAQPDLIDPTSVTKDVSTGESSPIQFLKQQLNWNRSSKHDPHVTVPSFNGKQLKINVAQIAHIVLPKLALRLMPLTMAVIPVQIGGIVAPVPVPELNTNNALKFLLLLACAYRSYTAEK